MLHIMRKTWWKLASRRDPIFRPSLFTYFFAVSILSTSLVSAKSTVVVSRKINGDDFTNPHDNTERRSCDTFSAICVDDLLKSCSECRCNNGNETYRFDLKKCVARVNLDNYSGCMYKGLKDHRTGLLDGKLTTLDLTKRNTKNIQAPIRMPKRVQITCKIANTSGYLDLNGDWAPLPEIADALRIDVSRDVTASVRRYLNLKWEGIGNSSGMLIKLDIICNANNGIDSEKNCFLFKSTGRHVAVHEVNTPTMKTTIKLTTRKTIKMIAQTTPKMQHSSMLPTTTFTEEIKTTVTNIQKAYNYSIPQSIIIGISAGVALVILMIIFLAVYCVRRKIRKMQTPPPVANAEAPKVHFTAQSRFSLIRESAQIEALEPTPGDYATLQASRESYDPYCSLKKDDVDLNVIDQVLKEAISIESVQPSSEPRYSFRLSGNEMVVATVPPRSSDYPKYHVLESDGEGNEPDYEEVDSSDDDYDVVKQSQAKPPLPDREYHTLEPLDTAVHSKC